MAPNATVYHLEVGLSDVDRGVYESLDLRVARHPSETVRYMLIRTIAYCLSYEEGIAFSKGGLSTADEPPLSIDDPTGNRRAWIDVGTPSAERLHRASKATPRVELYTAADIIALRREASSRPIHRLADIVVWRIAPALLDAVEPKIAKHTKLEIVRNEGLLYVTLDGATLEGPIERLSLVS